MTKCYWVKREDRIKDMDDDDDDGSTRNRMPVHGCVGLSRIYIGKLRSVEKSYTSLIHHVENKANNFILFAFDVLFTLNERLLT